MRLCGRKNSKMQGKKKELSQTTGRMPTLVFNVCAYMRWHLARIIKFCAIHIENVNLLLKRFAVLYYTLSLSLSLSPSFFMFNLFWSHFFAIISMQWRWTEQNRTWHIIFSTTWHSMFYVMLVLNMQICSIETTIVRKRALFLCSFVGFSGHGISVLLVVDGWYVLKCDVITRFIEKLFHNTANLNSFNETKFETIWDYTEIMRYHHSSM